MSDAMMDIIGDMSDDERIENINRIVKLITGMLKFAEEQAQLEDSVYMRGCAYAYRQVLEYMGVDINGI